MQRARPDAFDRQKTVLAGLRHEWDSLPSIRVARISELERDRRQVQLHWFLDDFEISSAKIDGIGPSRKQVLQWYGRNALKVLDQEVGWHRLLRMKPDLESMVEDNEASPLTLAAEQYATVNKYAGAFLEAFTFRSAPPRSPSCGDFAAETALCREAAHPSGSRPGHTPQPS